MPRAAQTLQFPRLLVPLAAAAAALFAPLAASADPAAAPSKEEVQVARELFEKALVDERGQDWAAAYAKLERAIAITESPGVRFHLAFCEEKLGHLAAALADYQKAKARAEIEGRKDVLAEVAGPLSKLSRRVPRVVLRVLPAGAAVTLTLDERPLNGAVIGAELPIDPGRHRVSAEGPAGVASEVFDAVEGGTQAVNLTLAAPTAPAPAETPAKEPTPTGAGTAAAPAAGGAGAAKGPPARKGNATPWILAGSGVAVAGGGLAAFLVSGGIARRAEETCAKEPRWQTCSVAGDRGTVRALDGVALGAFLAGAGLLTSAFLVSGRDEGGVVVSVGPQAVHVRGSF